LASGRSAEGGIREGKHAEAIGELKKVQPYLLDDFAESARKCADLAPLFQDEEFKKLCEKDTH
jgi:hypothetical protein